MSQPGRTCLNVENEDTALVWLKCRKLTIKTD